VLSRVMDRRNFNRGIAKSAAAGGPATGMSAY
jgi:hypothetical protein